MKATLKFATYLNAALFCCLSPLTADVVREKKGIETLKDTSRGFSVAAKKAMPAVVSIKAVGDTSARGDRPQFEDMFENPQDYLMRRFFGFPVPDGMRDRALPPRFGSGFIISSNGYILTNNHVLRDASEIIVSLPDESEKKAQVVGRDVDTDLAVIKIDAVDLPFLKLGDSESIEIGDWVIAIGSPNMLKSTLTVGVVSAKGRNNLHLNLIEDYIQTDAAINPGNSGGPLLNIEGEVIGVNVAIASSTGSHIGLGFAIPSKIAQQVSEQLIKNGAVQRVLLGILVQPVDEGIAQNCGLDKPEGFIIASISKDSAAEKGNLKLGDIILTIDGQPIKSPQSLRSAISLKTPGSTAQIQVLRERKRLTLPVILQNDISKISASLASKSFGFEFENCPSSSSKDGHSGVKITSVETGSPAYRAKIQSGSILLAVNSKKVHSIDDCKPLLEDAVKQGRVLLLIQEKAIVRYVALKARS